MRGFCGMLVGDNLEHSRDVFLLCNNFLMYSAPVGAKALPVVTGNICIYFLHYYFSLKMYKNAYKSKVSLSH